MLKSNIKNGELLKRLASMGQGDALSVVGCRFALPEGLPVIDLALAENLPTIEQVVVLLSNNVDFSELTLAHELNDDSKKVLTGKLDSMKLNELTLRQLQVVSKNTRFIIRTGDMLEAGALVLRI